jgi:hypothetical protein
MERRLISGVLTISAGPPPPVTLTTAKPTRLKAAR